jgi:hypothetical protein
MLQMQHFELLQLSYVRDAGRCKMPAGQKNIHFTKVASAEQQHHLVRVSQQPSAALLMSEVAAAGIC